MDEHGGFGARGGWWVVAQVPLMLTAFLAPLLRGAASFDEANPAQIAGAALTGIGIAIAAAGVAALGRSLTPFPRPLDGAALRQSGVYGWVRHPIYCGIVLATFGWSLAWLSAQGALCGTLLLLFFDRKSAFEERLLRAHFPQYGEYARRVRKLLPWVY